MATDRGPRRLPTGCDRRALVTTLDDERRDPTARSGGTAGADRDEQPDRHTWRGAALGFGFLLLVAGWLTFRAWSIQADLHAARSLLLSVRADLHRNDPAAAALLVPRVQARTRAAADAANDPLWGLVSRLPLAGASFRTAGGVAQVTDELARRTLPALVGADAQLADRRAKSSTGLPLRRMAAMAPALAAADAAVDAAHYAAGHLPRHFVLGPVAAARLQLQQQLATISKLTRVASVATRIGPQMLGESSPQRYFLAFENPAEARPDGGNLGAFAILTLSGGRVRVGRIAPNTALPKLRRPLARSNRFLATFGPYGAGTRWTATNLSPNFPDDAAAWAAMYRSATGRRLDGVIAIDPVTLRDLARTTGGALHVPGVGAVYPAGLVRFIESGEYADFDDRAARQAVLATIARQILHRALSGGVSLRRLASIVSRDGDRGHLRLASTNPDRERALLEFPIAGAVPTGSGPYAGAFVTNAAGSKLDYYLTERVQYLTPVCRAAGTGTVAVQLHNGAPVAGLPRYVTLRSDRPAVALPPAENRDALTVVASKGAHWLSGSVDGRPLSVPGSTNVAPRAGPVALPDPIAGHPAWTVYLELPPGATRSVVVNVSQPASSGVARVAHQAMVHPVATAVAGGC